MTKVNYVHVFSYVLAQKENKTFGSLVTNEQEDIPLLPSQIFQLCGTGEP